MILQSRLSAAIAALLSISSSASAADSSLQLQTTGRRHLKSNKNIAQQIKDDKAKGIKSKLTIEAKKAGGSPGQTSSFKVHLVDNAVQVGAKVITNTGETHVVGVDEIDDMLVTDDDSIGLIAVKKNGKTHGIIVDNSPEANVIISQDDKAEAFAYDAPTFQEPEWKCSSPDHKHDIHEPEEPVAVSELGGGDDAEMIDRHLGEHHHHHHDDHDHSHHHHDHGHSLNVHNALDDLRRQLRGSSVRLGKKHRVLQGGAPYEYQVDVYVEVDQDLCNTQGDTTVCPGTATENYVNAIFTGANTVYEPEIHTHLNVIAIAYTAAYDVATGSGNALDIMRANFGKSSYTEPFHYEGADLHHALLGKGLGGGIAYVGALCRSDIGFGLSASLTGSYTSMNEATVWDMKVFTHELGHNFGSGHTHDITQYDPVVDTCGTSCPASVPSDSATIMSYCQQCAGYGSIEYTFGGTYVSGDRKVASSYSNVPLAGSVTNNAKRVNVEMYNHVRTSTDSYFPGCLDVTPKCQVDSECPDEPCRVNVCTEYGTCELQAPSADCCGNGVCDGQEDWQSCPQDGCSPPPGDCSAGGCPTITTEFCSSCNGGVTNMFKVTAIADLVITRLSTLTYAVGSGSVKVFGKSGDYTGSEYNSAAWTQHYSGNISVGSWSQVALPRFTDTIFVPAGSSYSFYVSSTLSGGWNMLFTAGLPEDTVFTQNSDMQVYVGKGGTCVSPGDGGCGMYAGGVLFNGVLEYSTVASSTPNPTDAQVTPNPVTSSPITSSPITSAPATDAPVTGSCPGCATVRPICRSIDMARTKQTQRKHDQSMMAMRNHNRSMPTGRQFNTNRQRNDSPPTNGLELELEVEEDDSSVCNTIITEISEDEKALDDCLFEYTKGNISLDELTQQSNVLTQLSQQTQQTIKSVSTLTDANINPDNTQGKVMKLIKDIMSKIKEESVRPNPQLAVRHSRSIRTDADGEVVLPKYKFTLVSQLHLLKVLYGNIESDIFISYRGMYYMEGGVLCCNYNAVYTMVNRIATIIGVPVQALGISPVPRGSAKGNFTVTVYTEKKGKRKFLDSMDFSKGNGPVFEKGGTGKITDIFVEYISGMTRNDGSKVVIDVCPSDDKPPQVIFIVETQTMWKIIEENDIWKELSGAYFYLGGMATTAMNAGIETIYNQLSAADYMKGKNMPIIHLADDNPAGFSIANNIRYPSTIQKSIGLNGLPVMLFLPRGSISEDTNPTDGSKQLSKWDKSRLNNMIKSGNFGVNATKYLKQMKQEGYKTESERLINVVGGSEKFYKFIVDILTRLVARDDEVKKYVLDLSDGEVDKSDSEEDTQKRRSFTNQKRSEQDNQKPTPAPTTDAPVTSAPTNPPTLQPTPNPSLPPTPPPSPPPTTPAPTDPPVVIVVKQLCIKDSNLPGADICTDGSTSGTCDGKSEGSSCGGGRKCRFESCVGGPGPATTTGATTTGSATTTTEAPPATTTEDPGACGARRASCSTGGDCCSGSCSIDRKGNGKCA